MSGRCLRSARIISAPMVRLGAKCPSMTSMCSMCPPLSRASLQSAIMLPKSAERMDTLTSGCDGFWFISIMVEVL